ncbi:hypothetical protein NLU13_1559 [Sarocladium strictum]|uniref:Ribosomal protein bL31m N-terminal domain-containing protein n=1 Tax=Sarocladium strictum TaxID=5046 RepID=A0AA39GRG2_SARSR|nr:hypothetical protein NLU13_1559 [Sarocladium strictum]
MAKLTLSLPIAFQPTRTTTTPSARLLSTPQIRHATFIARPRRPYTFTQLVQLSDGSTYTRRTTSPNPLYRAAKDTRNTILWQPTEKSLRNVELDEAGRLAAFRSRFGRGFDAAATEGEEGSAEGQQEAADDGFADLLAEYAPEADTSMKSVAPKKPAAGGKKKR